MILRLIIIFIVSISIKLSALNYDNLYYHIERYSSATQVLINDNEDIYHIYLKQVKDFLPHKNKIQQKKVLAIDNTILRKFIKTMHKKTLSSSKEWWQINPYNFFIHLKTNTVYNYVILKDELIIACTARSHDNFYKNKFSKHYFISGLKNSIYYGGQIMTYMKDEKIIVLLNNASGTYKPHDQDLPQVINLLKYNFGDHDYLIFKAKSFNKPIYQKDNLSDTSSSLS